MKNEEKTDLNMLDINDAMMFESLRASLKQDSPEPPEQLDSFIKAAARQQIKNRQKKHKTFFVFISSGIAAAFAVSFSVLFLNPPQHTDPAFPADQYSVVVSQFDSSTTAIYAAANDAGFIDPAWSDVLSQINDFSSDLNETDMEAAALSAWDQCFTSLQ